MRENRTCGSEGGAAELNRSFLPLSRPPPGGDPAPGNGGGPICVGGLTPPTPPNQTGSTLDRANAKLLYLSASGPLAPSSEMPANR